MPTTKITEWSQGGVSDNDGSSYGSLMGLRFSV